MAGVGENDLIMNQAITTAKSSHSNFAELIGQVKSQNHLSRLYLSRKYLKSSQT